MFGDILSQIAKLMGPTWGPPGSCRPQMGPMLAPWTLLSGVVYKPTCIIDSTNIHLFMIIHVLSTFHNTPNTGPFKRLLTHWGRATHICVGNITSISSDNGWSPDRRQAIIWTNAGILFIRPLGTSFNEMLIEILTFLFMKMGFKVSSAKWRPFCLGLNVLKEVDLLTIPVNIVTWTPHKSSTRFDPLTSVMGFSVNVKYALIPVVQDICPVGQVFLNRLNYALGRGWIIPNWCDIIDNSEIITLWLLCHWVLFFKVCTAHPKNNAYGSCFVVYSCVQIIVDLPISVRITSLALAHPNNYPSASEVTLKDMGN